MGYISNNLLSQETIQKEGKISIMVLVPHFALMLVVIGFLTIIKPLIAFLTTETAITNKRFIMKTGLIARDTFELSLGKVENVQIEQSILGRILNYGDIIVTGSGGTKGVAAFINDPNNFKKQINAAVDAVQNSK